MTEVRVLRLIQLDGEQYFGGIYFVDDATARKLVATGRATINGEYSTPESTEPEEVFVASATPGKKQEQVPEVKRSRGRIIKKGVKDVI